MKLQSTSILLLIIIAAFFNDSFSGSIFVNSSTSLSTVVATDPQNDVIEYSWNNSIPSTRIDQSKPNIDISNNATVQLTLAGTPIPNNQTFYWLGFSYDALNITGYAWSGSYDSNSGSSDCKFSCIWLSFNSGFSYQTANASISGNSITWTFPSIVQTVCYNYTDYSATLVNTTVNMPATANGNWSWNVLTWTGTFAYSSDTSTITSGTWWEDVLNSGSYDSNVNRTRTNSLPQTIPYLNSTLNSYPIINTYSNSNIRSSSVNTTPILLTTTPSFGFISILGILIFNSFIIFERRRK